jgi:hypothetical protein
MANDKERSLNEDVKLEGKVGSRETKSEYDFWAMINILYNKTKEMDNAPA